MSLQASDSLVVFKPCDNAKARLVCFAHAGGGPTAFAAWADALGEQQIEVVAISARGRERRVEYAPVTSCEELVDEVVDALLASGLVDDLPYAFYGHSLGALVAYETAMRLEAELVAGRPRPLHLFASGHGAPDTAKAVRSKPPWGGLSSLSDGQLIEAVQSFGVMPQELSLDPGLMSATLPALRADFMIYEAYTPASSRAALAVPITALGGQEDPVATADHLQAWEQETSVAMHGPHIFPGSHFFINTSQAEVLALVGSSIHKALNALPKSILKSSSTVPEVSRRPIYDVVLEVSQEHPNKEALVDSRSTVPYSELMRRADLVAVELHTKHLQGEAGKIVALLMGHDATYVTCMLGIWRAAGAIIVIEAHFPPQMCKEICEESLTRAAVTSAAHASKFADVANCSTLVLDENWFSTSPTHPFGELPTPSPEDLAILMMTSGTTGRPKTIAGSHFFMHSGARAKEIMLPYQEHDNREAFNVMFVWEVMRPLLFGHTAFLLPDEAVLDPGLFVSLLQKHRCSRALTTPSLLSTILQHSARGLDAKLSSMKTWLMCGEVLPMKTVQLFRQVLPTCRLVNDYSAWESGDVAYAVVSPASAYEPSTVFAAAGDLAPMVCAAILDPETQMINPLGVTGELFVGGEGLSFGYHAQLELTATKFKGPLTKEMEQMWPGKWYKTGDAARLVGSPPVLEVRGRIDSTVKIRGFKVGIPVVEGAIQEIPGVASCVVVPVHESPAVVDSLLCFLVPAEGMEFQDLVQRVKQEGPKKIPRWMLPSYFRPLPEGDDIFSGGESRKLNRKKLLQFADLPALRASQTEGTAATADRTEEPTQEEEDGSSVHAVVKSVWAKALNLSPGTVDLDENFFDLGGHSTLAARIAGELSETYGLQVTVLDIYSHSTLGALLDFLDAKGTAKAPNVADMRQATRLAARQTAGTQAPQLAVAGMAGRFPGANSERAFWSNLRAACTSATFFPKEFLRGKGLDEEVVNHKDFVPCAYMIDDADKFDHTFFGIGRHEAAMMDPQHRVFIETTWAAIENAGLPPKAGLSDVVVGVFAAAGIDGYMVHHLDGGPLKSTMDPQDIFLGEIGNEKDYIATRVSYLLDFTGPAMNVNSACSSALVAVAQAGFAIAANQCDAAVAGASSITFPNLGYFYQDGLVNSVDGYVRPFDAAADGTVFGDAVASLLLRHAEDVRSTPVWGRVSGFSVTNDGGQKAGYAAPSSTGQSMAIMNAMKMMGEDPWSISYVECHATGTRVGDGIEVRGLMDSFEKMGGKKGPRDTSVALGSVKGNIAHANCAAGATGLMKVLLMLQHRELVPTANFAQLNSKIRLDGTPFFVNPEVCPWNAPAGGPRRAGVSSFGIGGTNAHAILEEESPQVLEMARPTRSRWPFQLLPLSAKTPSALSRTAERLASDIQGMAESSTLEAAAYTLQVGRTALPLRKALVVPSPVDGVKASDSAALAATALQSESLAEEALEDMDEAKKRPPVAFVFPGQGSQYFGMAQGLYDAVPLFRTAVDHCCDLLAAKELLGHDLRPILFADGTSEAREKAFTKPSVLQPSLFVVEYALARVFAAIGVLPVAVAGHSLGEYAAAVIGGLLTLESAIAIVAARARSTETLAEDGAMLSVAEWSDEELGAIERGERPGLWLAAVNSPVHAVISGETDAVDKLAAELKAADRKCTKLHVQKAFHSGLIAKAAETLAELGMPAENATGALPVASNYHGGWLTAMHLKDGRYWVNHMRGTVRWRDNAQKLMKQWHPAVVLEVGPGNSLSTLTAKCVTGGPAPTFLQAMRHPKAKGVHDVQALLEAIGQLWECGCTVDWNAFHTTVLGTVGDLPPQVRLASYAFDRTSLWVNPKRSAYVDHTEEAAPAGYELQQQDTAVVKPSPRCLVRLGEATTGAPAIRAYCLPFASGSATLFAPWARDAGEAVEVVALELPGRGGRSEEGRPSTEEDDEALLDSLRDAIMADLRGAQYVLVGFSMGGGLSMDLAFRLMEKRAPPPLAIYIAGRKPPAADPKDIAEIRMSNQELASYAFAPPEVAETEEFLEHVVPLLRADLELDARAERRLSAARLAGRRLPPGVGLEVSCGTSDEVAPWIAAPGWQSFASDTLGLHYYPGGHEFMQEQRGPILAAWKRDSLGRLMQRRALEMAMLAAQGFASPAFAGLAGLPGSGARPVEAASKTPEPKEEPSKLPFYAVHWVRTEPVVPAGPTQEEEAFFVSLGCDVVQATLDAAASAMAAGSCVIAACAPTTGLFSDGTALDREVQQCWQFTRLVQHFLEVGARGRLVVLCPVAGTGAMVAGASKAVAMEADELQIMRVFLPVAALATAAEQVAAIMGLVGKHSHEADLWVQDDALQGTTYTSRLEQMAEPSSRLPCMPRLGADGGLAVYVLTGATGGLGKAVVDWLLTEQGLLPEQLVLLRRAGSSALSGSLAQCRVVEVASVDSSEVLVSSALKEITNITGVFHLAGVLDDGIISGMTQDRFQKVAAPKCGMFLALLHAAKTLKWPLQWALGFSSTSSLFGYAGQVNYCAANSVLDQLASFGAAGVLPEDDAPPCKVLTINWGPWAEAGMAKVGTKAYEQAVAEGDTPLPTSTAIRCLAAALRTTAQARPAASQFAACNVDWGRSQWRSLPMLDLVFDKAVDAHQAGVSAQGDQVATTTTASPQGLAEDFLVQHCHNGKWSKIQGKTLNQLGLDSLEVVQLRNFFNKKHQVTVPLGVFADPSRKVGELAEALSKHLASA